MAVHHEAEDVVGLGVGLARGDLDGTTVDGHFTAQPGCDQAGVALDPDRTQVAPRAGAEIGAAGSEPLDDRRRGELLGPDDVDPDVPLDATTIASVMVRSGGRRDPVALAQPPVPQGEAVVSVKER